MAGWIILIVCIVAAAGCHIALRWMANHCPLCSTRWAPTGARRPGGSAGGNYAELIEWRCPACGHIEWSKTTRGGWW